MKVTIKRGKIETTLDRKDLIQIVETHDGIVFNFKEGVHLYVTDIDMPLTTKKLIKAADSFPKGDIIFNLNDYNHPTAVQIN